MVIIMTILFLVIKQEEKNSWLQRERHDDRGFSALTHQLQLQIIYCVSVTRLNRILIQQY